MKKRVIILVGCVIFAVAIAYAAGTRENKEQSEIALLKKRVDALENKVNSLEQRLSEKEKSLKLVIPPKFPEMQPLPEGWQQREFNGLPYYLVPLDKNTPKAEKSTH